MQGKLRDLDWVRTVASTIITADTRRPHLLARLDAALDSPWAITLVAAGAGCGKTRLLAQWMQELELRGSHVVWWPIEKTDEDLTPLLAALERVDDAGLRAARASVSTASARGLASLVRAAQRPVVVIIDNVQWIRDDHLGKQIADFARAIGGDAHVVLAGRCLTRLSIARIRVSGVALELTSADLAFTPAEIRGYFDTRGIHPSHAQLTALFERTGGWVTAFRLMELSRLDSLDGLISGVRGDSPAFSEYFTEEVFGDLPQELRDFAVRTSVPDAFTVELARTLAERPGVRADIDALSRQSILSDQRGDDPLRYRYHPLFREFLRSRTDDAPGTSHGALQEATARWFAERHDAYPALVHALRAGAPAELNSVVRTCGLQLVLTGRAHDVVAVLENAPHTVRRTPAARMLAGTADLVLGNTSLAITIVRDGADPTGADPLSSRQALWRIALGLHAAVRRGGIEHALARFHEVDLFPSGEPELDVYVCLQVCRAQLQLGRLGPADHWGRQAMDLARTGGFLAAELQALSALASIALYRGELSEVMRWGALADQRWRERGEPIDVFYQSTRLARAWALNEQQDSEAARALVARAAPVVFAGHEASITRGMRAMLSLLAAEDTDDTRGAANAILEHVSPHPDRPLPPNWYAVIGVPAVHALNRLGHLDIRDLLIRRLEPHIPDSGDHATMKAIALLHDGDLSGARKKVLLAINGTKACIADASLLDAWLVAAVIEAKEDHPLQATRALARALQLAAPESRTRAFRDAGPVVHRMLAARSPAFAHGPSATRVRRSLAAAGSTIGHGLTPREVVVLRGLSQGQTLRVIAVQEFISMNTVKTHVRNIYRKLGVSDRASAAAAARTLGILRTTSAPRVLGPSVEAPSTSSA